MTRNRSVMALLIFAPLSGCRTVPTAGNPCAKVETTADDFGKRSRGRMFMSFGGGSGVGLAVENGRPFLRAILMLAAVNRDPVPKGTFAKVALGNGAFFDLKSATQSPALPGGNQYGMWTRWIVDFSLSDSQLNQLKSAEYRALKMEVAGMEAIVKDDDATAGMQFLAQCLGADVKPQPEPSPTAPVEL